MIEATEAKGKDRKVEYQPLILVIAGAPLHGKTTLAAEMAKGSNLVRLDVDEARAELFPDAAGQMLSPDQERFIMLTSYQSVHEKARDLVKKGQPVVIAGAYTRPVYHEMLQDLAKKTRVPLKVMLLECTEEEALARLAKRNGQGSLSNVTTPNQYREIRDRFAIMPQALLVDSQDSALAAETVRRLIQSQRQRV